MLYRVTSTANQREKFAQWISKSKAMQRSLAFWKLPRSNTIQKAAISTHCKISPWLYKKSTGLYWALKVSLLWLKGGFRKESFRVFQKKSFKERKGFFSHKFSEERDFREFHNGFQNKPFKTSNIFFRNNSSRILRSWEFKEFLKS